MNFGKPAVPPRPNPYALLATTLAALLAILPGTTSAPFQPPPPLRAQSAGLDIAGQLGGPIQSVAVMGEGGAHTLVGVGPRIILYTFCGSEWPIEVGRTAPLPGLVEDIALRDGLAYVAAGVGGLVVVDVRDPAAPRVVGRTPLPGVAAKVVLDGARAYVAAGAQGLRIVDIADPAAPRELGFYQAIVTDFAIFGTRAYVVARNLQQVDVSNPAAPKLERKLEDWSDAVDIVGPYVIVAVSDAVPGVSQRVGSLRIYDVSNNRRPILLHHVPVGDQARAVVRVDGHVLWQGPTKLSIIAQNIPATLGPVLGSIATPDSVQDVWPHGRLAYLAAGRAGLRSVLDWPAPATARERQILDTLGSAESVAAADGYLYVEDEGAGNRILVVDALRPTEPRFVGAIPVGVDHGAIVAAGGWLYAGVPDRTLRVFDVRVPAQPRQVAQIAMPRDPVGGREAPVWRLVLDGTWLHVANDEWLRVFDVADPTRPVEISRLRSSGGATDVGAHDKRAYVLGPSTGTFQGRPSLQVMDVFIPQAPELWASLPAVGSQGGVQTDGSFVFVEGLQVVDVRAPKSPVEVARLSLPGRNRDSALVAGRLYLARTNPDTGGSLRAIDVSAPAAPREVASLELVEGVRDVAVAGGYVFGAAQGLGLVVARDPALPLSPAPAPTPVPTRRPELGVTVFLPMAMRGPLAGVCR